MTSRPPQSSRVQTSTGEGSRRVGPAWPFFPAVRLLRLVAGALAVALVLGLGVQAQATQRLKALVDSSWRGSYDLIVSAPAAAQLSLIHISEPTRPY